MSRRLRSDMSKLVIAIGHQIESFTGELNGVPVGFADGLCERFADDWNLYNPDGTIPDWLSWVVVAQLAKHGIIAL
jgi:hypothetical protein